MNLNSIKSFSEHHEFMNSISCLMFNFAYNWHLNHLDESITKIMRKRTQLFLLYGMEKFENIHPGWNRMIETAEKLFKTNNCDDFETAMFQHTKVFIKECAEKTYTTSAQAPAGYNAGSLKYDAPLDELPKNHCNFHIANAVAPKSIFADHEYLPNCFLRLMDESEKRYGYDTLRTFTWLNDRPRWLELFPEEWHNNLDEPSLEIFGNYGFWGQVITARGMLNEKVGEYVRLNCELKYKPRKSHCSFWAMRKHLNKYIKTGRE